MRGHSDVLQYISYFFNEVWTPNFSCPLKNKDGSMKDNWKGDVPSSLLDYAAAGVCYGIELPECSECGKSHSFPDREEWAYCPCDGVCRWCDGPHGLPNEPFYYHYASWDCSDCFRCGGSGARFYGLDGDFFSEWNEEKKSYIFYVVDDEREGEAIRVCTCKPVDCLLDDPIEDDYMLDRWLVGGRPEEVNLLHNGDDETVDYLDEEERERIEEERERIEEERLEEERERNYRSWLAERIEEERLERIEEERERMEDEELALQVWLGFLEEERERIEDEEDEELALQVRLGFSS